MPLQSINPYTGEPLEQIETIDETALEAALDAAARAASTWGARPVAGWKTPTSTRPSPPPCALAS